MGLLLEAGADPNTLDDGGRTALFHAATPESARTLIDAGMNASAVDEDGLDALQEHLLEKRPASARGRTNTLADGADIERRDRYGHTRLYSCAFNRAAGAVELLLELGAG